MRLSTILSICLLSAIVLSVVKAEALQLPLRLRHRTVVRAGVAASRGQQNFTDSGPFGRRAVQDEVFTVDLSLGTPARNFNATLDYQYEFAVFFGPGQASTSCPGAPLASRRYYDPSASSSARKNPQSNTLSTMTFREPYVQTGCASFYETGTFFNDSLKIGGVSADVAFAFMPSSIGLVNNAWPSDAILGLSRPEFAFTNWLPLCAICGIVKPLDQNVVTMYYDGQGTGLLTLGGVDKENCDSAWTYTGNREGWKIKTTFSFGEFSTVAGRDAYLVSTTAFITAPNDEIFYAVVRATGAEYDFKSDTYVVACDQIGKFPDMVFGMYGYSPAGYFDYRLPSSDYIRKNDQFEPLPTLKQIQCTGRFATRAPAASTRLPHNAPGKCTLMLNNGDGGENGKWTLGSSFARPYCTLFNLDTMGIAFAKALR